MDASLKLPLACLAAVSAVAVWSAISPHDRLTWYMETIPAFFAMALLAATWRSFPLTGLLYVLIALHCVVLLVGGHYTYARVPAFNWLRDTFDLARNHYDRVGHLAQGFIPAMIARELLLRTSPLRHGKWLLAIILLSVLGISAAYELLEWLAAEAVGDDAVAFLATQGDIWDTQKDMALALTGAALALLTLSRLHDRQMARLRSAP